MSPMFVVIIIASVIIAVSCESGGTNDDETILYLQKYGYLDTNIQSLSTSGASVALKRAISLFQEYYQLPGDGVLNNVTLQLMRKPRCGLEDIQSHAFTPHWRKWPRIHLTWNFHLADENILKTTKTAFDVWAANSSLSFKRVTLNPDILISFRESIHTHVDQRKGNGVCPAFLDGPGEVLAHAFYPTGDPNYISEVHIDRAELWYIHLNESPSNMLYLLHTLVHEIGHSLGLAHSTRRDSVMFAYVPDKTFPVKLSIEDILAIQHLYGTNNGAPRLLPTPPPPPLPTTTMATTTMASVTPSDESVGLCALKRVDAVLILNHRIFIAYQRYVWSINLR